MLLRLRYTLLYKDVNSFRTGLSKHVKEYHDFSLGTIHVAQLGLARLGTMTSLAPLTCSSLYSIHTTYHISPILRLVPDKEKKTATQLYQRH